VIQREGHLMGELVGLGLRGIGKSEINIDLVPVVVEEARAADRRKPFLIAAAAVLLGGLAVWTTFQGLAASKGADFATAMADQRDTLAPLKTQIDGLLRREAAIQQIAGAYTAMESDHAFWMDLLAEVREAFASDAVWLTDFEPIKEYDPLQGKGAKTPGGVSQNGKSVIKPDFAGVKHGASAMSDAGDAPVMANAVRIKGFWRENPRSQNVVSELLKKLREKSSSFQFVVKDPKGAEIILSDEQILDITVTGKPGELGLPFEITLPLARQIAVR
jgi:hypothetical protein